MQSSSSRTLPAPKRSSAQAFMRGRFGDALHSVVSALHLSSLKPRHRLSHAESGHAMDDSAHPPLASIHDSALDPEQVQICCDASGADVVLGKGGYGVVSLPLLHVTCAQVCHLLCSDPVTSRDCARAACQIKYTQGEPQSCVWLLSHSTRGWLGSRHQDCRLSS